MNSRFTYILRKAAVTAAFVIASLSGCHNASAAPYALNVADFSSLSVDNGVNVCYKCLADSAGWVVFDTEPSKASKILLKNDKSNLRIQIDIDEGVPDGLPTIRVYSSMLCSVSNSGDSLVTVSLTQPVEKLKVKVIGNGCIHMDGIDARNVDSKVTAGRGAIRLKGSADKANMFIAGSGRIDAGELAAREVRSSSIGPGRIICNPMKKLRVSGLSGHVYYLSEPEEITRRGMGVKALPADSLQ